MAIGGSFQPVGNAHTSSVEHAVFEDKIVAYRISEIPSNQQMDVDYGARTDAQPVYLGYAPKGLADGADGWLIQKYTYDGSDRATKREIAYGNWTNRAAESYS